MMHPIEYVYRFDPKNPTAKQRPTDAQAAKQDLEKGNRTFSRWMARCRAGGASSGDEAQHLIDCNLTEVGLVCKPNGQPRQAPFAVAVGCSDARVPTEMIFGQGFNDLFVVRVAGNVLGDVCQGSIDFAVNALGESVKLIVVLGHSMCGGVTGAVDAYLQPAEVWSKGISVALRRILEKILLAVREGDNALREVWGGDVQQLPGYRDALIETAVCLNAAQTAFDLRQELERAGRKTIEVCCGVYNLHTHQVAMPFDPCAPLSDDSVNLAAAPASPQEFKALAFQMAQFLKPVALTPGGALVSFDQRPPAADAV